MHTFSLNQLNVDSIIQTKVYIAEQTMRWQFFVEVTNLLNQLNLIVQPDIRASASINSFYAC